MPNVRFILLAAMLIFIAPVSALSGDFDGSKPLLCASMKVLECTAGGGCVEVLPEDINAPQFFRIDFRANTLGITRPDGSGRSTRIERTERVDGKLFLQGAEEGIEGVRDGLGWTMAIREDTGRIVLTASGDDVAFVIFGASGDLTRRKLIPALFSLHGKGRLPQPTRIVGFSRTAYSDESWRDKLASSTSEFVGHDFDKRKWDEFAPSIDTPSPPFPAKRCRISDLAGMSIVSSEASRPQIARAAR